MKLGALGLGMVTGGIICLPLVKYMDFPTPYITIPIGIILFIIDERILRRLTSTMRIDEK